MLESPRAANSDRCWQGVPQSAFSPLDNSVNIDDSGRSLRITHDNYNF
ncbi:MULTISPECIES: hypothetical protein [unclassified Coleofasciculus]|nr:MULTISPECIES: hypothetical protein [unclassified Coleofasciculus]MBD2085570.1 hypothetical protein [Coleofasciculus sp. FACHB-542]MBD2538205.1 hypothetical protein [Coleofasciculus sp. FACHB-SPT36]